MKALRAVLRVQIRYWLRHRMQAALCLTGIVLGVAVFTAIQLANRGALRAFAQGSAALTGSATHRVIAPAGGGVPETLYARLAVTPGVEAVTPVLRTHVRVQAPEPLTLTVLGLEPLSDAAFRRFALLPADAASDAGAGEERLALLERFLTEPGAVLLPAPLAVRLGLRPGDAFRVEHGRGSQSLRVLAVFTPPSGQAAAFARTVVLDVAAHQERFGSLGRVDALHLILVSGAEAAVAALLPPGTALEPAGRRVERVETMSRAFRLNVEVLGLFALLVALLLIFNAASFAVLQREGTLGMLRCIGAGTRTLFAALLGEALLVGALGSVLGVLLGQWLGALMLRTTGATLFEVVLRVEPQPAEAALDARAWGVGLVLGVGTSLLGAWQPAWRGARVSPLAAVRGARQGSGQGFPARAWALGGLAALGLGTGLLALPGSALGLALAGATILALGAAAACPLAVLGASRLLARPLGALLGATGRLAARNLGRSLARTGVAAASLMVALALVLAIEITVRSFKQTFALWLAQVVTADLYVEPADEEGGSLEPALLERLRAEPSVADLAVLRARRVVLETREVLVLSVDLPAAARQSTLPTVDATREEAYAGLARGEAFVSETLATPLRLRRGDTLALPTSAGMMALPIAAVVQNYTAPQGVVYLSEARFAALFGAEPPRRVAVWLRPGADATEAQATLEGWPELAGYQVLPNAGIREDALRLFDRTFAITDLMGTLAAFVAFIAVVSALAALLEERRRVHGYLRAIGVSRRQLGAALTLEALLLAGVSAAVSWAAGLMLAWLLVFEVNVRAFGWTLQFLPGAGGYGTVLLLALGAALLGSAYPVWRATRASVTATIREE